MSRAFDDAAARYRPIFHRIAEGAPQRERERILPFEQFQWLKEAGFGAARIAAENGGDGLGFAEFFQLYTELAEADSNVAHAWRGHFEFLEVRRKHADPSVGTFWNDRVVQHREAIGNAWSEKSDSSSREPLTKVTRAEDGRLLLNGAKHFSTGTLYGEWVDVLADVDGAARSVVVPTSAAGLERLDDWDGFGQTLTGTGTTLFVNVEVNERDIDEVDFLHRRGGIEVNVFQLVLLSVLVGIARRALSELKAYLLTREKPTFGSDGATSPRHDPLVQLDVGRISIAVFQAEAALSRASAALDSAEGSSVAEIETASLETYKAQAVIIPAVLDVTSRIFDTVGASATSTKYGLDRHWRNARIISSHNSLRYRERNIGAYELLGALPGISSPSPSIESRGLSPATPSLVS